MKLAIMILLCGLPLTAAPVVWTDWTSGTAGTNGSATGVLDIGGTIVDVRYTGEIAFIQTGVGTNYYTEPNAARKPYTATAGSPTGVDNAPPAAEMIALSQTGAKTLTFSQPIDNLFFAVVSLNGNGYQFNNDFDVVSWGQGFWGCGALVRVQVAGGYQANAGGVCGSEPHGIIRFTGAVSSVTWTSLTNEYWNGFTVGTYGLAPPPTGIPEPSTWTMAFGCLGAILCKQLRRRARG
jgi:hypothetical protein